MIADDNIDKLNALHMKGIALAYERQRNDPALQTVGFDERLAMLLECQFYDRDTRRMERIVKSAHLKFKAMPEDFRPGLERGVDPVVVNSLLTCDWLMKCQNLLITGLAGVGKTWLACMFAVAAARKGITSEYMRLSDLCEDMQISRHCGSLYLTRSKILNTKLLIIDDWGLAGLTPRARQDLFEIIDDRLGVGSLIIAAQMPVDEWYDYLGLGDEGEAVADAILDRLIHSSHRLELLGDSQRAQPKNPEEDGDE